VNWVLDADIRSFFDTMKHEWIVKFLEHRIADERVVRLIQMAQRRRARRWGTNMQ
jgi:retron-type reverse transcriptase